MSSSAINRSVAPKQASCSLVAEKPHIIQPLIYQPMNINVKIPL